MGVPYVIRLLESTRPDILVRRATQSRYFKNGKAVYIPIPFETPFGLRLHFSRYQDSVALLRVESPSQRKQDDSIQRRLKRQYQIRPDGSFLWQLDLNGTGKDRHIEESELKVLFPYILPYFKAWRERYDDSSFKGQPRDKAIRSRLSGYNLNQHTIWYIEGLLLAARISLDSRVGQVNYPWYIPIQREVDGYVYMGKDTAKDVIENTLMEVEDLLMDQETYDPYSNDNLKSYTARTEESGEFEDDSMTHEWLREKGLAWTNYDDSDKDKPW